MKTLNSSIEVSGLSRGGYTLTLWVGAAGSYWFAQEDDRLHFSHSYSLKRLAKRRERLTAKYTKRLAQEEAILGKQSKQV